jgi:DNA-binding transcriptional ArsR family regulator
VTAVRPDGRRQGRDDRLARVVGRTRAQVLAAVSQPQTTEQVAHVIGAASSTASEHLTALHGVGLLTRRRAGRHVYYQLSARGQRLLELLREEP